jgi:ectoine hydroxylase-related dioxygenase (phytanoyl-CoA dioxygenase family)
MHAPSVREPLAGRAAPADASREREREQHRAHCRDREDEFAARLAFLHKAAAAAEGDAAYRHLLAHVEQVALQVHRHGFAVMPGLFDAAAIARLRDGLAPLLATSQARFDAQAADAPRPAFHVHNALAKTRAADEAALQPALRAVIGGILGFDYLFHAGAIVTAHSPGCCDQPLHRDDASFYALPRPRMPLVLTAAIALDDFIAANGATRVAPDSCWWERARQPLPSDLVQVEMPAGSVLLWDGAIFHGGGANRSPQARRTLLLNYTRGWLRTQYNQFLSVPRETVLALPAELQKDLGYARSLRALGECDGQEPLAYLRAIQRGGDGVQPCLGPESAPGG